jgi:hypothetical protein
MALKRILLTTLILAATLPAHAAKPCEELKSEIDAKIQANGVPAYALNIVDAAEAGGADGKVVGSCDGGTRRIVYLRGQAGAAVEHTAAKPAPTVDAAANAAK